VSKIAEYFHTDWEAMTTTDWVGTILTVIIFLLTVVLWIYVFHPRNRDRLEKHRDIPMHEDRIESENNNGQ